jgi:uncharacterized membrane protein YoaK (UPF0700 family)
MQPANAMATPRVLAALLLALTVVTGIVDAVSYLKLGRVFVANMTGNVVFLGFAAAGARALSVPASLAAIAAFLAGSLAAGRFAPRLGERPVRLVGIVAAAECACVGSAAAVAAFGGEASLEGGSAYVLIAALGLAMGAQNAAARKLAIPDLTTTVLTLTMTGIAADSALAGGANPRLGRRVGAVAAMLAGAGIGAALVLHAATRDALLLASALLLAVAISAFRATP